MSVEPYPAHASDPVELRPARESDLPELRAARESDLPELARLQTAAARELSVGYSDEQVCAYLAAHGVADAGLVRDGTYSVADVGGRAVGCGGWSFRSELLGAAGLADVLDPETEAARMRAFFVDPGWARRGIGRRLLRHSEAAARARGYRRAVLAATPAGRPLYESEGWALVRTEAVAVPGVQPLVTFLMEKTLG